MSIGHLPTRPRHPQNAERHGATRSAAGSRRDRRAHPRRAPGRRAPPRRWHCRAPPAPPGRARSLGHLCRGDGDHRPVGQIEPVGNDHAVTNMRGRPSLRSNAHAQRNAVKPRPPASGNRTPAAARTPPAAQRGGRISATGIATAGNVSERRTPSSPTWASDWYAASTGRVWTSTVRPSRSTIQYSGTCASA